ncbi:MAG: hypothetical protein LDL01_02305 [Ignavibacterium sp.]|nr:hypothetical protein [Ignavibacterium sp.]
MKFLQSITNILIVIFLLSTNSFSQLRMDENLYNEIQQKLIVKYGDSVELLWIYQIDSLELYDGDYPLPYKLSDPYGTLAHTTIFTAIKDNEFSCEGLVGIYKNGSIIWDSDTTINCTADLDNYTGLVIFSVSDINRDGTVDIVLSSISLGPTHYSAVQRLYAYSWDGSNGWLITDTDSEGRSTLDSFLDIGDFDFVDVDGDGIYEITADWYINLDEYHTKSKVFTYYWNGYKYAFDPNKPQPQPYDFLVQNNIDVLIKASVEKIDSLYKYNYVLHNLPNSKQEINAIYFQCGVDSAVDNYPPYGWFSVGGSKLFGYEDLKDPTLYSTNNFIRIDSSKFLGFSSSALPSIIYTFIQTYNQTPPLEDTVDGIFISYEDFDNNILVNSVKVLSVGPSENFYSLQNIEIIDSLLGYTNQSFQLGWIKSQQTVNKYDSLFTLAKTQLQQNYNTAAKTTLQTIIQQVDLDSTNNLTSEAYALIRYNTEYLIEKIPQSSPDLLVKLVSSQGFQLPASNVQYYEGSWKDAVNNGDGTFTVITSRPTVSIRVFYEYASQQVDNVPAHNNTYTFQTVSASVQLRNSQGLPIDTGTVQYYAGAWRSFGTTVNGVATKELLPINYSFRMTYAYASIDKQQNLSVDPVVVFQTVNAQVQLKNSLGNLIDQGTVQYYAGAWRSFGTTVNGVATKELLPINYSFRMTYEYVSKDKQQNLSTNPVVEFTTVLCTVKVSNSINQPISNSNIKYYAGGWRDFGVTNTEGITTKELLPQNISFRASYGNVSQDKQQDLGVNSLVEILLNVP